MEPSTDPVELRAAALIGVAADVLRPLFAVAAWNGQDPDIAAVDAAQALARAGLLGRPLPALDRNTTAVGRGHPDTARRAAVAGLPRSGSFRAEVFRWILCNYDRGMTDDEIELKTGRPHQTVSARRKSLLDDGWIEPRAGADGTALTRQTRNGRDALVWFPTVVAHHQVKTSNWLNQGP